MSMNTLSILKSGMEPQAASTLFSDANLLPPSIPDRALLWIYVYYPPAYSLFFLISDAHGLCLQKKCTKWQHRVYQVTSAHIKQQS